MKMVFNFKSRLLTVALSCALALLGFTATAEADQTFFTRKQVL
jgi:hypothetical protein